MNDCISSVIQTPVMIFLALGTLALLIGCILCWFNMLVYGSMGAIFPTIMFTGITSAVSVRVLGILFPSWLAINNCLIAQAVAWSLIGAIAIITIGFGIRAYLQCTHNTP